jgi:hypothetical protein
MVVYSVVILILYILLNQIFNLPSNEKIHEFNNILVINDLLFIYFFTLNTR